MNFENNEMLKLKSIIISFIISITLVVIILSGIKKSCDAEYSPINRFYSKIIEYTIPVVKANSLSDQNYDKRCNVKKTLAKVLGINSTNSIKILGREISYITVDKSYKNQLGLNEINDGHMVNRFCLNDDQVYIEENKQHTNGNMSSAPVFSPALKRNMKQVPEVLIYHTHSCEGYAPYAKDGRSVFDQSKNVTGVGEKLKKELEKYGIKTINDTTVHDIKDYNNSYRYSKPTLEKYLKKYGNFKLIIDLHRDSIGDKKAITTNINGENVARFGFVMTRRNPRFLKQSKLVNRLIDISNRLYPGDKNNTSFYKRTFYYDYGTMFFHQDERDTALLIEVGSYVNTLREAQNSTKYLARIIAEYLNGKN